MPRDPDLYDLAGKVAVHLPGWNYRPDRPDPMDWWVELVDGQGGRLHLSRPYNAKERVRVSGLLPPDTSWRLATDDVAREITVAIARGPETIAAEIRRRFLPGYLATLAKARQLLAKEAAEETGRRQTAARLARALPGASIRDGGRNSRQVEVYWHDRRPGHSGRVIAKVHGAGREVSIEADWTRADVAEAMLALVGQAAQQLSPRPEPTPPLALPAPPLPAPTQAPPTSNVQPPPPVRPRPAPPASASRSADLFDAMAVLADLEAQREGA